MHHPEILKLSASLARKTLSNMLYKIKNPEPCILRTSLVLPHRLQRRRGRLTDSGPTSLWDMNTTEVAQLQGLLQNKIRPILSLKIVLPRNWRYAIYKYDPPPVNSNLEIRHSVVGPPIVSNRIQKSVLCSTLGHRLEPVKA